MDFKQLEAFVKVVELASFSKAAEELFISQPSVSTYITALEKELNTVLINRSTKVLSTTMAGERFFDKSKELLALKREAVEMLNNLSQDASGEIRILASSVPALYLLPQVLASVRERYPKISFTVNQVDTVEVVQGIAAHKADIGFVGSVLRDKRCEFFEYVTERLIFAAPSKGYYSANKTYSLKELLYSNDFISREYGSGTRIQYEKYFAENGVKIERVESCATMDSTYSVIHAIKSGVGISMVSELAVQSDIKKGQLLQLKLDVDPPKRKIYTVLNKNVIHSHLVKLFMEQLKKASS